MSYQQAVAAFQAGDFRRCEELLRPLLLDDPHNPQYLRDLGGALGAQGRFAEARAPLERCHELMPDDARAALSLGAARLAEGDFAGGWPLYDQRLQFADFHTSTPPFPVWRGEDLRGKTLLVWREQGFGDMIMCARFLPVLRELGARVVAVTAPSLASLYAQTGVDVVAYAGEEATLAALPVKPDFISHPFSLPRWLGVTLANIPAAPYLAAEPRRCDGRIGVVWRGRPTHVFDRRRSLPAALGQRLLALPGAISLDPADTGARDFMETAQIVAGLEMVITVDTAVAHLAGALGKPVGVLLPQHGLDWRWMVDRADSPWYPSAKLLRQPSVGAWAPVVEVVCELLGQGVSA